VFPRFPDLTGFDWDEGNRLKNEEKHQVSLGECEQLFFNEPLVILDADARTEAEARYAAFGRTDEDRVLTIIFTIRGPLLRVISARDMSRKERKFYHEYREESSPEV
jgi:uncharacterized DUF497 family protein